MYPTIAPSFQNFPTLSYVHVQNQPPRVSVLLLNCNPGKTEITANSPLKNRPKQQDTLSYLLRPNTPPDKNQADNTPRFGTQMFILPEIRFFSQITLDKTGSYLYHVYIVTKAKEPLT
jgi:hypothetical protein